MPETRFTSFSALSVDPRTGIFGSASMINYFSYLHVFLEKFLFLLIPLFFKVNAV